jgi:hypothetical protein
VVVGTALLVHKLVQETLFVKWRSQHNVWKGTRSFWYKEVCILKRPVAVFGLSRINHVGMWTLGTQWKRQNSWNKIGTNNLPPPHNVALSRSESISRSILTDSRFNNCLLTLPLILEQWGTLSPHLTWSWTLPRFQQQAWLFSISFEVMLPSTCSFIVDGLTFSCRCSTLRVSAYMAIFRCVWCFSFIFLKESPSLLLLLHADGNITSKLIEQYSAAGC